MGREPTFHHGLEPDTALSAVLAMPASEWHQVSLTFLARASTCSPAANNRWALCTLPKTISTVLAWKLPCWAVLS